MSVACIVVTQISAQIQNQSQVIAVVFIDRIWCLIPEGWLVKYQNNTGLGCPKQRTLIHTIVFFRHAILCFESRGPVKCRSCQPPRHLARGRPSLLPPCSNTVGNSLLDLSQYSRSISGQSEGAASGNKHAITPALKLCPELSQVRRHKPQNFSTKSLKLHLEIRRHGARARQHPRRHPRPQ